MCLVRCFLAVLLVLAKPIGAHATQLNVVTTLQATYSITYALAEGTSIKVENVPGKGRRMHSLESYFDRQGERLERIFSGVDAIVSIGKVWRYDPLYRVARQYNIRTVNIDASKPWSSNRSGVSVIFRPDGSGAWEAHEQETSDAREVVLYVWLSLSNGARMADLIADDLMRLAPSDAERIQQNLAAFRRNLLALKSHYEIQISKLEDTTLFALADEFVYLTTELGIYVDDYFIKQDIHWTSQDIEGFTQYLKTHGVKLVVHKWEPSAEIHAAIIAAGARLLVLRVGDSPIVENGKIAPQGYQQILESNLESLYKALLAIQVN